MGVPDMKPMILIILLALPPVVNADTLAFTSSERRVSLLELYTSEGCSSCPPAEHWLGRLAHSPRLWHEIVPVAFHVDYWDYLGWRDPYASARFSARQQDYAQRGYLRTPYTPGLMLDGREWRGFFGRKPVPSQSAAKPGRLQLKVNGSTLQGQFKPSADTSVTLRLNVAVLGFDVEVPVQAGENRGRTLVHDFVVLTFSHRDAERTKQGSFLWPNASVKLPKHYRGDLAIAAWVSATDDPTPLQATGGWLRGID